MKEENKKCFSCGKELPLSDFFSLPEKDYQLKSDKGHSTNCRSCTYDWIVEHEEKLHPYRKYTKSIGEVRRFTSIPMSVEEAYSYCFMMDDEKRKLFTREKLKEQGLEPYNY